MPWKKRRHPLIVSPADREIQGMNHAEKGDRFAVDVHLDDANPDDFDALLLPGGLINPDTLRSTPDAVKFAKSFFEAGKPVAAICHGPQVLIEAGVLKGRKLTSWPAIQTDIKNAGGNWVDQEVVTDHGFVTSRKPDDIPAFNKKMVEEFAEGYHAAQKRAVPRLSNRGAIDAPAGHRPLRKRPGKLGRFLFR